MCWTYRSVHINIIDGFMELEGIHILCVTVLLLLVLGGPWTTYCQQKISLVPIIWYEYPAFVPSLMLFENEM